LQYEKSSRVGYINTLSIIEAYSSVVKCVLNMHEDLSSISSTKKNYSSKVYIMCILSQKNGMSGRSGSGRLKTSSTFLYLHESETKHQMYDYR
jgi:hypothetical protein